MGSEGARPPWSYEGFLTLFRGNASPNTLNYPQMPSRRSLLLAAALPRTADAQLRSLFDGRTPSGWTGLAARPFPTPSWTIENGCLKTNVIKPVFEDIRTQADFAGFDLSFEWKISPGGNSGIKYLIYKEDVWQPKGVTEGVHARGRGFEYQIADDAAWPEPEHQSGAIYGFLAPTRLKAHPAGAFNQGRIVRKGTTIEHWLNGEQVLAVRLDDPAMQERMKQRKVPAALPARTPIVLQNHASEAWFRQIQIREL